MQLCRSFFPSHIWEKPHFLEVGVKVLSCSQENLNSPISLVLLTTNTNLHDVTGKLVAVSALVFDL
jgi:hypothetical protein